MNDYELIAAISKDIDQCKGDNYTEVSNQRSKAMEYYLGEPYGNEVDDELFDRICLIYENAVEFGQFNGEDE